MLEFARARLAELMPEGPAHDAGDYLPSLLDHIVAHLGDPRVHADDDGAIATSAAHHGRQAHQRGTDIQFVVHDIGFESVDLTFVGFPDVPPERLGVGG